MMIQNKISSPFLKNNLKLLLNTSVIFRRPTRIYGAKSKIGKRCHQHISVIFGKVLRIDVKINAIELKMFPMIKGTLSHFVSSIFKLLIPGGTDCCRFKFNDTRSRCLIRELLGFDFSFTQLKLSKGRRTASKINTEKIFFSATYVS
ncbi:hypothetical protein TNCT_260941 [Trichonephila clavata]|uniref:Uncharacterized protein n=1 Tax=Trichonephila clavata TaxID=2740835 RepID=A0A8X6H5M0_TRICU|nr:hypothetical protein TNCT_260941 [Trichonephila clavata]